MERTQQAHQTLQIYIERIMTQEEKQLLLKDLCGRLLYQPKLQIYYEEISGSGVFDEELYEVDIDGQYCNDGRRLEDIKPYLRPMSSMTEEEKKELSKKYVWNIYGGQIQIKYHSQGCWDNETECPTEEYIILFDYLNKHHFDYRGLISKGLALEAPEGMYK